VRNTITTSAANARELARKELAQRAKRDSGLGGGTDGFIALLVYALKTASSQ
jgi:hypothetical protein